ncbi:MAG: hypothetical protein KHY83_10570 [Coriobacteriia bacterium]|nr:hypothetical protein [Coriobacteriia bacterium]MBS5479091.1 hypothetical protein [Coriobacteriia bacterium]
MRHGSTASPASPVDMRGASPVPAQADSLPASTIPVQERRAIPVSSNVPPGSDAPGRVGRRLTELRLLSPCLFGFAFVRAFYDVASGQIATILSGISGVTWLGPDIVVIGMVPAFVACVAAGRRFLPLSDRRSAATIATALMVAGAGLILAVGTLSSVAGPSGSEPLAQSAALPLALIGGLVVGFGIALGILLWAELQSCFGSFLIVLYVAGGFLFGSLLGWLIGGLNGMRLALALLALPILSHICLRWGLTSIPPSERPGGFTHAVQFPWRLAIALGVYEFVLGVRQASAPFADGMLTMGVLLSSMTLFCLVYFFSHRFDFTYLYRTPFVLMSCGLLVTFASLSTGSGVADLLVCVGYALMFLVLTVLLCDLAHRYGVSAAFLCSIQELIMLTSLGGHGVGLALDRGLVPLAPDSPAVLVALVILVIVASVVLLTEREYARWGAALFGMEELTGGAGRSEQDVLGQACEELAARIGLSPREREVLQLLAQGKGPSDIERELCIAPGTLKSHTRRIYRKASVHSREELVALIDASSPALP